MLSLYRLEWMTPANRKNGLIAQLFRTRTCRFLRDRTIAARLTFCNVSFRKVYSSVRAARPSNVSISIVLRRPGAAGP